MDFRVTFQDQVNTHNPSIFIQIETKLSGYFFLDVASELGFPNYTFTDSEGLSGGISSSGNQTSLSVFSLTHQMKYMLKSRYPLYPFFFFPFSLDLFFLLRFSYGIFSYNIAIIVRSHGF